MGLQDVWHDIYQALLPIADEIPDLQVYPFWNDAPTPPALDFYPDTPFQTGAALPAGDTEVFIIVRARVATNDLESAQRLLLRLLDSSDPASVEMALQKEATPGAGAVAVVVPEGVSGLRQYGDDLPAGERMIGCDWKVSTFYDSH